MKGEVKNKAASIPSTGSEQGSGIRQAGNANRNPEEGSERIRLEWLDFSSLSPPRPIFYSIPYTLWPRLSGIDNGGLAVS